MPRVRVEDYEDFEDATEFDIDDDDPLDRAGRKITKPKPTKEDLDWEETRRRLQWRKNRERD